MCKIMSTPTTSEYLIENAKKYADKPALSSKNESGDWDTTTWSEFYNETMSLAKSLMASGFQKGDKLSIYSYNRKESVSYTHLTLPTIYSV